MSKSRPRRKKPAALTQPTPAVDTAIPDDLNAHVETVRAFATCHGLLQVGQFTYPHFKSVAQALLFLQALHERATNEAKKHPKAHLVPEFKMEAKNGKSAQA